MINTPDSKLAAFAWLSIDRWDADTLFNYKLVDGYYNCKVCDEWVKSNSTVVHARNHVKEEQDRRARISAENAAKVAELREFMKSERKALKPVSEFYAAPCVVCNKPIKKTGKRGRPPVAHPECKEVNE